MVMAIKILMVMAIRILMNMAIRILMTCLYFHSSSALGPFYTHISTATALAL